MIFLDRMPCKIVTVATGEYIPGSEIKAVIPVGASATFRANAYVGDSHTVDGVYASAGLTRLPGEVCYGQWNKITVTSGTVIAYYTDHNLVM